jgi:hypothetical protein
MRIQERGSTACAYQQRVSLVARMCLTFCTGDADPSGIMVPPKEQVTAQKYDLQFGTNVIGKYLLSSD